jgi:quinol monooxygenase YgiN
MIHVIAVRAERGCIEYGAAIDAENALAIQAKWGPDTFLVIEKWESMDALRAHAAAPHMAAYGSSISSHRLNVVHSVIDAAIRSARLSASLQGSPHRAGGRAVAVAARSNTVAARAGFPAICRDTGPARDSVAATAAVCSEASS